MLAQASTPRASRVISLSERRWRAANSGAAGHGTLVAQIQQRLRRPA